MQPGENKSIKAVKQFSLKFCENQSQNEQVFISVKLIFPDSLKSFKKKHPGDVLSSNEPILSCQDISVFVENMKKVQGD